MPTIASKDGTPIAYDQSGSGPAVVLVDGALTYRGHWGSRPLAEALSDTFTVYTYDRRGRGESGDTQPYAAEREIEDIAALIEAAGGRAYLYGVSSGAALAVRAASALGSDKVPRLAVYEPPYSTSDEEIQGFFSYRDKVIELLKAGKRSEALESFLGDFLPPEEMDAMKKSPDWPLLEAIAPTLAYENEVMGDSAVPVNIAKNVRVPVLVIDGAETADFLHAAADQLAKALPDSQRKTLAGQTHSAAPDALAPVLKAFFK
jgi:pimeloyl-ACP methyl ester carboxylesterase